MEHDLVPGVDVRQIISGLSPHVLARRFTRPSTHGCFAVVAGVTALGAASKAACQLDRVAHDAIDIVDHPVDELQGVLQHVAHQVGD